MVRLQVSDETELPTYGPGLRIVFDLRLASEPTRQRVRAERADSPAPPTRRPVAMPRAVLPPCRGWRAPR